MEHEVEHLQFLVEDLFTLARTDVGRLALQCEPADIGKIVRRVVESMAPLAWRTSKIEMVAEVPPELPLAAVDVNRLEQALQNLLHNAMRHTGPGGIIAVAVMTEPETLVLQVKDTGEGIAPEDLPRIWERFYMAGVFRQCASLYPLRGWLRQMDGEATSLALDALDRHAAAHSFDPLFDERAAQSGARASRRTGGWVETVREARQIFGRDALPGVFDLQNERFRLCHRCYRDDTARRGMSYGVMKQILQRLFQAVRIHRCEGQFRGYLRDHLDLARSPRERSHALDDAPDDFSDIAWLTLGCQPAHLRSPQRNKIFDEETS